MKTIAVMVGNNRSKYTKALVADLCQEGKKYGVNLVFLTDFRVHEFSREEMLDSYNENQDYQLSTIYNYIGYSGCDACIICYEAMTGGINNVSYNKLLEMCKGVPTLILEAKPESEDIPYLVIDNYGAINEMVSHLVKEHNLKNVVYIGPSTDNYIGGIRKKAYLETMTSLGIEVNDSMMAFCNHSYQIRKKIESILDTNENVEALCCGNDKIARIAYDVCEKRGKKIGEDISITGFGNVGVSSVLNPPLTTAKYDSKTLAKNTLEMILELINEGHVESRKCPVEIIYRNSCGCQKSVDNVKDFDTSFFDNIEDLGKYNVSKADMISIIDKYAKETEKIKAQSWLSVTFTRDLIDPNEDAKESFDILLDKLQDVGINTAYFFLHKEPLNYNFGDEFKIGSQMYFAGGIDKERGKIDASSSAAHSRITQKRGVSDFMGESARNYQAFVLFSGKQQFGVMICESDAENSEFLLAISFQIGNLLRYFETKKTEERNRREMKLSMDRIKETNQILSVISRYDDLTKILNRRGFMEQSLATIQRRIGKEALIMFADLDHLKEINDTFGHADGDYAICSAAKMLSGLMPRGGFCARMGGDEFVGLVPIPADESSEKIIEKLKAKLKDVMFAFNLTCEKPYFVEMSVGFYSFKCEENINFLDIIACSDEVLYEDKQSRRASIKK